MKSLRMRLNASTVLPVAAGLGVVFAGPMLVGGQSAAEQATLNPEAVPYVQVAQCNPCNPCAANPCNPCNPCAAKNPCNPCAANPCNPCNPCAAAANPCNPCAANPCNPCNPCAAAANPCNPCAANPCNPCAAGGGSAYSSRCFVPRLQTAGYNPCNPCAAANPCNPCNPCAAAANPCNPCAANPCNPCNPCAAAANPCAANPCNPCNPCAAAANPCNPCAANPCNPCNPCGAAAGVELTPAEALAAYDCMRSEMQAAYAASGNAIAINYQSFDYYSTAPYVSALHGSRYVTNVANQSGSAYGRYEEAGTMRNGSVLGKDSFVAGADGRLSVGPLFLMQKMPAGFNAASADWKYTMVMPDGSIFGETNGMNSAAVQFCIDCHEVAGTDHMFFLPVEFRVN